VGVDDRESGDVGERRRDGPPGADGEADGRGVDALRPLGVDAIEMPVTPERVWRAVDGDRE
jgi:hypothetical protein